MQDLVCGDRTEADPAVQALFARHPESEARYRRMLQVAGRLDEIGVDEVGAESNVLPMPTASRRLGIAILAAAALVVLAVVLVRSDDDTPNGVSGDPTRVARDATAPLPEADADRQLHAAANQPAPGALVVDRDEAGQLSRVRWQLRAPLRPGWYTVVSVFGGSDFSVPLAQADVEAESEWVAAAGDLAKFAGVAPTRVRVEVFRAGGRSVAKIVRDL